MSVHRLPFNRSFSPKQTVPGSKHKKPLPFDGTGSVRDFLIQFELSVGSGYDGFRIGGMLKGYSS